MKPDYAAAAHEYWSAQPHPKAPSLTIGDFATAVKLATLLKFGSHASSEEASLFWPQFKSLGIAPEDFEQAVERLAPVSFAYHGRPPTMNEIVTLRNEPPAKANAYFADLPDKHYPFVRAADMIKALQAAEPHAWEQLGRPPVKLEAAHLASSGEKPADYYARLAQPPSPITSGQSNIPGSENVGQPQSLRSGPVVGRGPIEGLVQVSGRGGGMAGGLPRWGGLHRPPAEESRQAST